MAVTSKTPASRKSPAWALPVLTGLTDGTLPPDAFAFYLCQDALYLGRYAQALAVLGGRAPEAGDVAMFARHAAGAIEVERHLHESVPA